MATEIGPQDSPLTASQVKATPLGAELAENACSFEFFQAVALLERLLSDRQPVGAFFNPADEAVRFHSQTRMGFPASEIHSLVEQQDGPPEMTVNFMGLTGPMGALPAVYSELMLDRVRAKDTSLAAFFDIFNHRTTSLFFRAWRRSRPAVSYGDRGRDVMTQYLLDLLGLGGMGLRERQQTKDEALIHYLALVAMQTRSATALQQLLTDYFEVPVAIEQFTGAWYGLDDAAQCALGEQEGFARQLGSGAVIGDAVWDRQSRVRVRMGPLTMERYNNFLPQGSAHEELRSILRFFANDCMDFEVQLVLHRSQVPAVELDMDSATPARLGWVSWARTGPLERDPDETILYM